MNNNRLLLDQKQLEIITKRLCYQLIENHNDFSESVILGLQPRGVDFSDFLIQNLRRLKPQLKINYGKLDTTFFRDDFRRRDNPLIPNRTEIDFIIENKKVILVDDVLYTGRSIRAGLDAMLAYGRPSRVELLVLVDRRWSRHLPIQPKYTGITVDSVISEKVEVLWGEKESDNKVILNAKN